MTFLVPQAFRIINLWEPGSASDVLYWKFWPYQAYFINVFGFCAMWLTVLMTAECYLYIFFPGLERFSLEAIKTAESVDELSNLTDSKYCFWIQMLARN